MEKIQSAIAKARAERADAAPAAPREPVAQASPAATGPADWLSLPELVIDPQRLERNRIVAESGGKGSVPFDMMRTRLLQQLRTNNWRRMAVTSPSASCGKSTISLNLAFSLARQADIKTCLFELDLRRPTLGRVLGLTADQSFAHVIEGTRKIEDNAVRFGDNLIISTTSHPWPNPAELLQSHTVAEALGEIEERYAPDVIIFDMPPMLVSDDVMAFVGQVDCAMLVAGAESTTIKEIDTCERDLATQTNVLGVVLNKCRHMGPDYGYGYYG